MKPTAELRFVERAEPLADNPDCGRMVRILQQWWESTLIGDNSEVQSVGEWRDVPLVTKP
jgi:hypothetical protein